MSPPEPSLEQWQEALRAGRSPQLRAWVKQGHEPPADIWDEASRNTWGGVGQRCFQALCAGRATIPVDALEMATSQVYGWGTKTFARLLPVAVGKDQWKSWLTQAWQRSDSPFASLLRERRWSSANVVKWLEWGVSHGWMSAESAVAWCCQRSEALILPLPRFQEERAAVEKRLALLANAIQHQGGFFTPALQERQARLFTQASKPSWDDRQYVDRMLPRSLAASGREGNELEKKDPPPYWLTKSVQWWGDFVVEDGLAAHPLKEVLLNHPACLETVFSDARFTSVRSELARTCGLAMTALPSSWWAENGQRFWSDPNHLPIAQRWLEWHTVGSEHLGVVTVVLQQLGKIQSIELPVDRLLRYIFSSASANVIAADRKAWLELPQVLGWSAAACGAAWANVIGKERVHKSIATASKFQQALEEWESLTGETVALTAPPGSACAPHKAWWERREKHRQLDAVLLAPSPPARKPLRF